MSTVISKSYERAQSVEQAEVCRKKSAERSLQQNKIIVWRTAPAELNSSAALQDKNPVERQVALLEGLI